MNLDPQYLHSISNKTLRVSSECFGATSLDGKTKTNNTYFLPKTHSFKSEIFLLEMMGGKHEQAQTTVPNTMQEPTYKTIFKKQPHDLASIKSSLSVSVGKPVLNIKASVSSQSQKKTFR